MYNCLIYFPISNNVYFFFKLSLSLSLSLSPPYNLFLPLSNTHPPVRLIYSFLFVLLNIVEAEAQLPDVEKMATAKLSRRLLREVRKRSKRFLSVQGGGGGGRGGGDVNIR